MMVRSIIWGEMHDKIKFQSQGSPPMTLFVNRQSGYISKMTKPHWLPGKSFNYHYSDWRKTQGVSYAADGYLSSEGKPVDIAVSRSVEINPDVSSAFKVPQDYKPEAPGLDRSQMTVKQLADDVYLAGSNWGFSIFYHHDDYFVAAGGYRGLSQRFEAVKKFAKVDKPLKYLVVSHHHNDHLAGMKEAAQLGVQFITVKAHVDSIRQAAEKELSDERFVIVNKQGSFADGGLKVVDYPNGHANHNLITYLPSAKTVFAADIYASYQSAGAPPGYEGLKNFKTKLQQAGFEFEFIAAAHSSRVLSAADLDASIDNIVTEVCPPQWQICTSTMLNPNNHSTNR